MMQDKKGGRMNNVYSNVARGGMDFHYKFSNVMFRDKAGRVARLHRVTWVTPVLAMGGSDWQRSAWPW